MKIRLSTVAAVAATIALTLTGCATSGGDSVDNQQIIENDISGDNPGFDAEVDNMEQDIYEERLLEACWTANQGNGWSEDDLYTYCMDHLTDYEDLGVEGGVPQQPMIDEINDCTQGSVEVYLFTYSTPEGENGEVEATALCMQDAQMYAQQQAPPGAFLVFIATV